MRTQTFTGPFECDASDQTTICVRHFGPEGWEGSIGQTSGGFSWGDQTEAPVRLDYDTVTGVVTVSDTDTEEHRSRIGQLTVASHAPFIVYGDVRGLVAECHTRSEAESALQADREDCAKLEGGAYSDAEVFMWDDGWEPVPYEM